MRRNNNPTAIIQQYYTNPAYLGSRYWEIGIVIPPRVWGSSTHHLISLFILSHLLSHLCIYATYTRPCKTCQRCTRTNLTRTTPSSNTPGADPQQSCRKLFATNYDNGTSRDSLLEKSCGFFIHRLPQFHNKRCLPTTRNTQYLSLSPSTCDGSFTYHSCPYHESSVFRR